MKIKCFLSLASHRANKTQTMKALSLKKQKARCAFSTFLLALMALTLVLPPTSWAVVFTTVSDPTNVGTMYLYQGSLGNSVLSKPTQLETGSNEFKYVTVNFRPTENGTYVFGQTDSPVDTIMIIYSGGFDPTSPGTNAKVGNDDTGQQYHINVLGADAPAVIKCGPTNTSPYTGYCPQVSLNVVAGQVYTLLVSVFNSGYNNNFTIPFDFYSNRDGEFRATSDMRPIDTTDTNSSADLDFEILREFKGGALEMDVPNGTYKLSFTVHGVGDFAPGEANRIDQKGNVSTFSGVLRDFDGQAGALTITNSATGGKVIFSGDNTYSGGTTIDTNALLSIAKDANLGAASGDLTFKGGTLENTAAMTSARDVLLDVGGGTFKTDANLTLSGQLTSANGGGLTKTGSAALTLTNDSSTVDHVMVSEGELVLDQAGDFNVTNDYTTKSGATTTLGAEQTYLNVGGTFTQESGSTLYVTINNDNTQADITADVANLGGTIALGGFSADGPRITASDLEDFEYKVISTTSGINGDFINHPMGPSGVDYVLHEGMVDGNNYVLKFKLAWTEGGQADGTGSFTMGAGTAFDLDEAINDEGGSFDSGWSGKDLVKNGEGHLTLSADNGYTGTTTVNGGTLSLAGVGDISESSRVTLNNDSTFDISGLDDGIPGSDTTTVNNFSGSDDANLVLGDNRLTANNTTDETYGGSISGSLSSGLTKQGGGALTLSHDGSTVGDVDVEEGTLNIVSDNSVVSPFTVLGDYTTRDGATTVVGSNNSVLDIGGTFTQEDNSILRVELGAWIADGRADIIADKAVLGGTLDISGFTFSDTPNRSSDLLANGYTLIHTTGGDIIEGGPYTGANLIGAGNTGLDYLMITSYLSLDQFDLNLGFALAWTDGGQTMGHGDFTIDNGSFTLDSKLVDQTGDFDSGWNGKDLTKKGAGILRLYDKVQQYSGKTTIDEGTIVIFDDGTNQDNKDNLLANSSDLVVNENGTFDLNGTTQTANRLTNTTSIGGKITLNGGQLLADNSTGNSTFSGTIEDGDVDGGTVRKTGSGELRLTGQTLWEGNTYLDEGTLTLDGQNGAGNAVLTSNIIGQSGTTLKLQNGAILNGWIDPTDVHLDSISIWNMLASSVADDLFLAGRVNYALPTLASEVGRTLTVDNLYGQGGIISLYAILGGGPQVSDEVIIDGGLASGRTNLFINNFDGLGDPTTGYGIEVVKTVNGGSTTGGAFALANPGGVVLGGPYAYNLYRNAANQNWYLTTYFYRQETALYAAMANQALTYNEQSIGSFYDRIGSQDLFNKKGDRLFWSRLMGEHRNMDSGSLQTSTDSGAQQIGQDLWVSFEDTVRTSFGLYAIYGRSRSDVDQANQAGKFVEAGTSDFDNKGLGAYFNRVTENGTYFDAVIQATRHDLETSSVNEAKLDTWGTGLAASLESGYTFNIAEGWVLEPQAQAIFQNLHLKDAQDVGGLVKFEDAHSATLRAGLRLARNWGATPEERFTAWTTLNLLNSFGSDTQTNFETLTGSDVVFKNALLGPRLGLKGGLEGAITKNVSLKGNIGVEQSFDNHRNNAISGEIGLNISF